MRVLESMKYAYSTTTVNATSSDRFLLNFIPQRPLHACDVLLTNKMPRGKL